MNDFATLFFLLTVILSTTTNLEAQGLHMHSMAECIPPAGSPVCDSMVQSRRRSPNQPGACFIFIPVSQINGESNGTIVRVENKNNAVVGPPKTNIIKSTAMKGQVVVVDVGYHVNGAKVTAYIKAFHPAGYTGEQES